MATSLCQDKQQVTPECEIIVLEADGDGEGEDLLASRLKGCKKNPGHLEFIPVHKFRADHLPADQRTPRMMESVFRQTALTVRIRATYTSTGRPDTFPNSTAPYPFSEYKGNDRAIRYGTGSIVSVYFYQPIRGKACPCPQCRNADNPKTQFWWVRARTATHVIYDRSEAEHARLDCFYDSENMANVKRLYGYDTFNLLTHSDKANPNDVTDILCVTHDRETIAIFDRIIPSDNDYHFPLAIRDTFSPSKIIVSHPHSYSKRITIGKVLHLTVPTGQKYPVDTPIPFKKGTIFQRRQTELDSQTNDTGPSQQTDDDFFFTPSNNDNDTTNTIEENSSTAALVRDFSLSDRLDAIRASIRDSSIELPREDNATTNVSSTLTPPPRQSKEDYLLEFYFLYLREQVLRLFVTSAMVERKRRGGEESLDSVVIHALDNVVRIFPGRRNIQGHEQGQCQVHSQGQCDGEGNKNGREGNKDGGEGNASEIISRKWLDFLVTSEQDFAEYLEEKKCGGSGGDGGDDGAGNCSACAVPFMVRWFEGIGTILDSIKTDLENKGDSVTEYLMPSAINQGLKYGLDLMTEMEEKNNREMKEKNNREKERNGDRVSKQEEGEREEDEEGGGEEQIGDNRNMAGKAEEKEEGKKQGEGDSDLREGEGENTGGVEGEDRGRGGGEDRGRGEGEDRGGHGERIESVPEGATFILPTDAGYAYRVYSRNPGWFNFPPGTMMIFPAVANDNNDGNDDSNSPPGVPVGEPLFQFRQQEVQPELSFVTYDIPACPGSSGANIYCDILGKFLGNYFPHSGHLEKGVNQSGTRDNFLSQYTKLFRLESKSKLEAKLESEKKSDKPGTGAFMEGTKSLIGTIKQIILMNL